jgi:hypothetical protein
MRLGRTVSVALSAASLAVAPVAAQAADNARGVATRLASPAENPEYLSKNIMLVVALLAVTVGVIALVHNHGHSPVPTPMSP